MQNQPSPERNLSREGGTCPPLAVVPTQKYIIVSAAGLSALGARWEGDGLLPTLATAPGHRSCCWALSPRLSLLTQSRGPAPDILLGEGRDLPGGQRLTHPRGKWERKKIQSSPAPSRSKGKGERVRDGSARGETGSGTRLGTAAAVLAQRGLPLTLQERFLPQHFPGYPVNKGIRSLLTCEVPAGSRTPLPSLLPAAGMLRTG